MSLQSLFMSPGSNGLFPSRLSNNHTFLSRVWSSGCVTYIKTRQRRSRRSGGAMHVLSNPRYEAVWELLHVWWITGETTINCYIIANYSLAGRWSSKHQKHCLPSWDQALISALIIYFAWFNWCNWCFLCFWRMITRWRRQFNVRLQLRKYEWAKSILIGN